MKIWIENAAIYNPSPDLLRQGALYGMKRLLNLDYELNCDPEQLTPEQAKLIENELITFSSFNKEEADVSVSIDEDTDTIKIEIGDRVDASGKTWVEAVQKFLFPERKASNNRKTSETEIHIKLNIDGTGQSRIHTGLKFFDHMLEQIAKHGLIDLEIDCSGDLDVDEHHTIEDIAITLGETIYDACGRDKKGIQRYGFLLAMDESQAEVALDLSNRPYLTWNVTFDREYVGDFPLEMAEHFFYSLAMNLKATLQIRAEGKNEHHKIESIFKGFAKALRFAVSRTERAKDILPSSKGKL